MVEEIGGGLEGGKASLAGYFCMASVDVLSGPSQQELDGVKGQRKDRA